MVCRSVRLSMAQSRITLVCYSSMFVCVQFPHTIAWDNIKRNSTVLFSFPILHVEPDMSSVRFRLLYNNNKKVRCARREWDAKIAGKATARQNNSQSIKTKSIWCSCNKSFDAFSLFLSPPFSLEIDRKQKQKQTRKQQQQNNNSKSLIVARDALVFRVCVCVCARFGHFYVCCKKSRITLKWIRACAWRGVTSNSNNSHTLIQLAVFADDWALKWARMLNIAQRKLMWITNKSLCTINTSNVCVCLL